MAPTVNFLEKAANDRLIAAIIGSMDKTINLKEVARLYGGGVSFNTIEWYLRKIRQQIPALKAEANGEPAPVTPSKVRARKAKDVSPKKATAGVKTGRVSKNKSPVKVKYEPRDDDDEGEEEEGPTDYGHGGNMDNMEDDEDDEDNELDVEV